MTNQDVQPEILDLALQALHDQSTRHIFIQELSNQRGQNQNELQNIQFIIMVYLFYKALDYIDQQSKLKSIDSDTLLLVNMSLTYYRKIKIQQTKNQKEKIPQFRRQYIAEMIKSHPCFSDFGFWYQSFKKEARQKFREQMHYQFQISQQDISTTESIAENGEYKEMYKFTKISTLQFYAVAFEELGRTKDDYIQFVDYVQQKFQLQLTQQERQELLNCYIYKIKYEEDHQEKAKYLELKAKVLQNFQLAKQMSIERKINRQQFEKMYIQVQIAQILDQNSINDNFYDFDSSQQLLNSNVGKFNIYQLKLPDNFEYGWL